jgi:serine phosphatase RsbU (regulator of sigma subunit)
MWNKLLERQIRRYIKTADISGAEFQDLFAAVSQAYTHHEEDRLLIERSLDLSSQELSDANRALREASRIIEQRNQEMIASLEYARLVQNSLLARESTISQVFPDSFIFNRPRDIVGGDFFWIREEQDRIYLSVADCTGHGVPGAFMSVIGFRLLNQAVRDFNLKESDKILSSLNEEIKVALSGSIGEQENKDAMDISLVIIDLKERIIQFSGLGQRIFLSQSGGITEIKGDRAHIGQNLSLDEKPITRQEFSFSPGDALYMFSDGFVDQFGGNGIKKFGMEKLKSLLSALRGKSFPDQKALVESAFYDWKGPHGQIDDVLLLGVGLKANS